jgi:hypothetical protein
MRSRVDPKVLRFGYFRERKVQLWHQIMVAIYLEAYVFKFGKFPRIFWSGDIGALYVKLTLFLPFFSRFPNSTQKYFPA